MNAQEIKIGTLIEAKDGSYEMVVYQIHEDGFDVRVFSKNGRQTGIRFVSMHELKYFNVK